MGCTKIGHCHQWPTSGTLVIQRCEIRCNFCDGEAAKKDWKYAWFLRRHVRAVHVRRGKYPNLEVDMGWDENAPKGTKEKPRPVVEKGGLLVKNESPGPYVQQPYYDGQHYGQHYGRLPGGFGVAASVNDRTVDPNSFAPYGVDPYAMSVSAIAFRTEDPVLLETHRANTMDDFEGWLNYLTDTGDMTDVHSGETFLMGSESFQNTIDPTTAARSPADTSMVDATNDLTAEESDIASASGKRKSKWSDSATASAKFFMDEYEPPSEDGIDDLPLADNYEQHLFGERPDFEEYWDFFSENVNKTTEQMRAEGVDVQAVQHMIPAVTLLAKSLQENK